MPFLVRFLIRHAIIGQAIALLAVLCLLWSDLGGLAKLIRNSEQKWLVLILLNVMMGLTFSSLQMGFAVMLLRDHDPNSNDGGKGQLLWDRLAAVEQKRLAPQTSGRR